MIRSLQKPMSCSATCPKQPINALNLTLNGRKRPTNALNLRSDWAGSASILAELGVKPSSATAKAAGHWPATFRAQKPGEAPNSTRFLPLAEVKTTTSGPFPSPKRPRLHETPQNVLALLRAQVPRKASSFSASQGIGASHDSTLGGQNRVKVQPQPA